MRVKPQTMVLKTNNVLFMVSRFFFTFDVIAKKGKTRSLKGKDQSVEKLF